MCLPLPSLSGATSLLIFISDAATFRPRDNPLSLGLFYGHLAKLAKRRNLDAVMLAVLKYSCASRIDLAPLSQFFETPSFL